MVSLPSSVPAPSNSYTYRIITQDKFTYALNDDATIFDAWVTATENTVEYNVPAGATTNAELFSSFVMSWKCNTAAEKDACCMVESTNGAVCTI